MEQLTEWLSGNWEQVLVPALTAVVGWLVGRGYLKREQIVAFVGIVDEILDALRRPAEENTEALAETAIGRVEAALGRALTEDERAQVRVTAAMRTLRDKQN